jgi:flagellar biosynthesis anti-sigma factor FlgM
MRITDSNSTGNSTPVRANSTAQTQATEHGRTGSASKSATGADRVELSGLSGRVASALKADSADRAAHVSRIAEAVRSGSYKVDAKAVSKALVSDALASSGQAQ